MGLETGTYISDLVITNPVGATDPKSEGDDHLRLIKSVLKTTLPNITGAVTATHGDLNQMDSAVNYDRAATLAVQGSWTLDATASARRYGKQLVVSGMLRNNSGGVLGSGGLVKVLGLQVKGAGTYYAAAYAEYNNAVPANAANVQAVNSGADILIQLAGLSTVYNGGYVFFNIVIPLA